MDSISFFSEDALLERLAAGTLGGGRPFVFLVGAPLTAPHGDRPGVPGVSKMIERVKERLGAAFAPAADSPNPYQEAFEALLGHRGPEEVNKLVREAVLEACLSTDSALLERALAGEAKACEGLERDPGPWSLSPGVEALGRLLAEFPRELGSRLLTTNFDPLVQVAIRRAEGRTWHTKLSGEGSLEQSDADGCHVIYLHGAWHGADTLHTPGQLVRPRPQLKASLLRILNQVTLVVLAYGGWKDVFTETLIEAVGDPGMQHDVIWTFRKQDGKAIAESNRWLFEKLAPQLNQRVNPYVGIDCNTFLPKLWERLQASRPLRPAAAAAAPASSAAAGGAAPSGAEGKGRTAPQSPFFPGQAILRDEDFFGRQAQCDKLADTLARGQSAQILGEWRMGKTSLLRWVERHAPLWQSRPVAWINAQGIAGRSPVELVWAAGESLGRVAEVERSLEEGKAEGETRAAERALEALLPAVLLIDEAAALAQSGHRFDADFLNLLRALGEAGQLIWVSASRVDLREIFSDTGLTSSFLNNAEKVTVGQLDEAAARALLARGELPQEEVAAILEETGGFAAGLQWLGDGAWRQGAEMDVLVDRYAEAMETDFRRWWGRLEVEERVLLKKATGGLPVEGLEPRERRKARALVDRGLLGERERTFSLDMAAWRSFVADV